MTIFTKRFSTLPTVAEGFQLKTWRRGPEAGKPKLSTIARGLVERGLMRLDVGERDAEFLAHMSIFFRVGQAAVRHHRA
jgi:hypothetical protein